MDRQLQLSYRAMAAGEYALVRRLALGVQAINTDSIPAMSDIATSYVKEGNCAAALPVYRRMIQVLESGGDPKFRMSQPAREELVLGLRGRVAKPCS